MVWDVRNNWFSYTCKLLFLMTITHYDTAVFYMFFSMMNLLCGYVILFVLIPKVSFTTTIAIFFICFQCLESFLFNRRISKRNIKNIRKVWTSAIKCRNTFSWFFWKVITLMVNITIKETNITNIYSKQWICWYTSRYKNILRIEYFQNVVI